MALKFLNKKGWHTGSLRNIENVWKAEQKHEAEERKLDEIRKQIQEERERAEFRQLQVQAGLIPQQERLEFLYDSGLAVGKNNDGFKALESLPKAEPPTVAAPSSSSQPQPPLAPGALFEDKPQSANDAWRKLHSDPLLLIRQREQEALAHIKNNPVRMAMIRKSVDEKKQKKSSDDKKRKEKRHHKKSKHHQPHSSDDFDSSEEKDPKNARVSDHRTTVYDKKSKREASVSDGELNEITVGRKSSDKDHKHNYSRDRVERDHDNSRHERRYPEDRKNSESSQKEWSHDNSRHERRYLQDQKNSESSQKEWNRDNSRHERRYLENQKNSESYQKEWNRDNSRNERRYPEDQKNSESFLKEWNHDNSRHERRYPEDQKNSESSQKEWNHDNSRHEKRHLEDQKNSESSHKELNRDKSRQERRYPEDQKNSESSQKERSYDKSRQERSYPQDQKNSESSQKERGHDKSRQERSYPEDQKNTESRHRRRNMPVKLSEEERAAKLREMQEDAEVHEEQRWKRIKKAADDDAKEAVNVKGGKNFLLASQENVYGVSKGGSTTIEESVRRRAYYSQGRSEADGSSAFRR
ncbi:pre-mRNA-splicing factor CWC25 homolog [Impatiens glandulifera]|uniref:pre-mRNA-splicing factor CWC25 homolog n=1 Tax=Impatiens glandulifera TaxID=253017 RepID=UPI001FB0C9E2|nr:pre-mRNA-splicing factor CWC25 homolog [Impatiens glandulifera]